jgi:hypothetical protein
VKVDFQGSRVTSDGGLILVRELDEHLGMSQLIEQHWADSRGKNTQFPLADLLRQPVYSRLAGYADVNDAERVSVDPGFIVTNLALPSRSVVRFYNRRGTAEQWIKEGKQATHWTRLSCHRFRANEVRLQLSVLAYNPGEPVAAAGATEEDRPLVADRLSATASEDRRRVGETCAVLLAAVDRRASDEASVRGDSA